jgi:hypothetical protein
MTTGREFPFHDGAKVALKVAGVLTMLLIVTLPVGIWLLMRAAGGKVILDGRGLTAKALGTVHVDFDDVARFGILRVPIVAGGIGGALARRKVGGPEGINLCFLTKSGKSKKLIVSQYHQWEQIVDEVSRALHKQPETLTMGLFGLKWPEAVAA